MKTNPNNSMRSKYFLISILLLLLVAPAMAQKHLKKGYSQVGLASYYSKKFHGKKTASGEKFNMYAMTAAHPKIPFNSIVKVTNLKNGKWVTLRINDRGPFTSERIVDVSKAAALKLDMVKDGVAEVKLELLRVGKDGKMTTNDDTKDKTAKGNTSKKKDDVQTIVVKKEEEKAKPVASKPKKQKKDIVKKQKTPVAKPPQKKLPSATVAVKTATPWKPVNTYNVHGYLMKPSGFGVQLGSFSKKESAIKIGKEAMTMGLKDIYIQAGWTNKQVIYRVLYGAKPNKDSGKSLLQLAKRKGFTHAFLKEHF
ncbi:septal ring lytic transglycosylase RlpA family protein [Rapidithrix thailandica]|uniref:Probable endolytic peptidoglycan transglycosylase RlpA n=1 Tax=Rapidithrix thailandica TaxID=413964 RepID=A0AAW9S388_9BACT